MSKDNNDFNFDDVAISPMRIAATQLHELYTEFRAAGFSRAQALKLVSDTLTAGMNNATDE